MNIKQLNSELEENLTDYKEHINFMVETFDQSHNDDKLTKEDMEEMGRQTFYAMNQFKNSIIKYLEQSDR